MKKAYKVLILAVLSLLFVFPLFWMVVTALKRPEDLATYPVSIMPPAPQWKHFRELLLTNDVIYFWRALRNSLTLSLVQTVIVTLSSALAGFGFARYRARGKDFLFTVLLATMMLPTLVTLIPQYILFSQLGIIGKPWPLAYLPMWLPSLPGWAFFIFLYRQFFATLPKELAPGRPGDHHHLRADLSVDLHRLFQRGPLPDQRNADPGGGDDCARQNPRRQLPLSFPQHTLSDDGRRRVLSAADGTLLRRTALFHAESRHDRLEELGSPCGKQVSGEPSHRPSLSEGSLFDRRKGGWGFSSRRTAWSRIMARGMKHHSSEFILGRSPRCSQGRRKRW
ncbi:MAG: carbohydrate ABC transporter permease [Firmicutes bacterium]|nr:carbohydrate ABC transporter permease [Bacillota bacterium]